MLLSQPSYPSYFHYCSTPSNNFNSAISLPPSSYPSHHQQWHHQHHQNNDYYYQPQQPSPLNQQPTQTQTPQINSLINNNNNSYNIVSNINEMITFGNINNSSSSSSSSPPSTTLNEYQPNPWLTSTSSSSLATINGIDNHNQIHRQTPPASVSSTTNFVPSSNSITSPTLFDSQISSYKLFEIKTEQMSPVGSSSNSGPSSTPTTIDSKDGIINSVNSDQQQQQRTQSELNVYSKCTVCEDVADGYHFSALSCAACSAFFRRSIADQKTYACVTRNCNVSINSRKHGVICRYCRFQKCIFAGMCPDEVQGKRTKLHPESPSQSSPASVSAAPYPTITTLRRGGGKGTRTTQARGPNVPLLNEMSSARRSLGNLRMMNLNCPTTTTVPSTPTSSSTAAPIPALITQQPFTMLEKEFVIFKKFCENMSMLNGLLAENEHWQFSTEIQNLFLTWEIFESVHATIRFGGIQTNRAYAGDLMNIDIDESSLMTYLSDGNTRDAASMARFAYPVLQFFNMHLCRNVQNMRLDEKEAAALMCLLLINQVKSKPMEHYKHQIFKELGEHYRNYEVDASVRLANIVLIISTFDEALGKAKEFLTCWNLFSFKF